MGQALSTVREDLAFGDHKVEAEALETLKTLEMMANDYMNAFYQRIENKSNDDKQIPIDKVLTKHTFVKTLQDKGDNLSNGVVREIQNFSSGPVGTGLANLATSVFRMLLGASRGQRSIEERYAISLGDCFGLSRLDMCFFTYKFESQSLYEVCESVVACCVVVSSANLDGINENTIRVLVNNGFENTSRKVKNLICDEMLYRVIHRPSLVDLQEDSKTHREAMNKYLEEIKDPVPLQTAKAGTEKPSPLPNNASATETDEAPLAASSAGLAPLLEGTKAPSSDGGPAPTSK